MYEYRFYRQGFNKPEWFSCEVRSGETDLHILSAKALDQDYIYKRVNAYRNHIRSYIEENPEFNNTLSGFRLKGKAPEIVKGMVEKTSILDVGPMASVAGAIAEFLGRDLIKLSPEFIIENGGDICLRKEGPLNIGIYAGPNKIINEFLLCLDGRGRMLGVCSSSSFLGHSLSLGNADLVTVISESVIFADGLATKIANQINTSEDVDLKIEDIKGMPFILGALIVKGDKIGLCGCIELRRK